jgi:hypothetical protein
LGRERIRRERDIGRRREGKEQTNESVIPFSRLSGREKCFH